MPYMFRGRLKVVVAGGDSADPSLISDRLAIDLTRCPCVLLFDHGQEIQRFIGPPSTMSPTSPDCIQYNRTMMQQIIDASQKLVGPANRPE